MRAVGHGSARWGRALLGALMAIVLSVVHLSPASAQDGDLDRVQALVDSGRFASARTELQRWLASREGTAERDERQRSLWLRGLLTVDPGMAELDYRRLVLEYPGGRYSDEALLRLARIARARADDPVARGYLETLIRDYPESPNRVDARSLLAEIRESPSSVAPEARRDAPEQRRDAVVAADPSPEPPERAQAQGAATSADGVIDVEPAAPDPEAVPDPTERDDPRLEPEVEPVAVSVPEVIAADAEPAAEPDAADEPDPRTIVESSVSDVPTDAQNGAEPAVAPAPIHGGPPPDAAPFTVQLGAFSVPAGAASIAERAEAAGFPVRMVRVEGSALIRVRVGAFADLDGALERMREIQAAGLEAVVARDRADETPYADPPL